MSHRLRHGQELTPNFVNSFGTDFVGPSWAAIIFLGLTIALLIGAAGCSKKAPEQAAMAPAAEANPDQGAPGPDPTPATAQVIAPADNGDINATLAELTRELHRNMIGRKLNRNFDEFVSIANIKPPPPPEGKRYSISPQWKVILVDSKP